MNDEQLIKFLERLRDYCKSQEDCPQCKFVHNEKQCFVTAIIDCLQDIPMEWDIERLRWLADE